MEYWYGILLSPSKSEYWYGMLFPLHGLSSWRSPWILGQRPFCAIQRLCPMSSKFQRLPTWSINSGPLKLPGTSWTSELLNHPLLWLFAVPRASSRHRTSLDSCRRPPFFSPKKIHDLTLRLLIRWVPPCHGQERCQRKNPRSCFSGGWSSAEMGEFLFSCVFYVFFPSGGAVRGDKVSLGLTGQ